MSRPDFLITGGMRCGSTTLHEMLRRQPGICMPEKKEIHFFDRRNPDIGTSFEKYQELFSSCPAGYIVGEATPDYLTTEGCDDFIYSTIPDVKLVTILRNPVERTWSHYQFSVLHEVETLPLLDALHEEAVRLQVKSDHTDIFFSYLQRSRYIEHIERFAKLFGRDQIKIVFFEELIREPQPVLDEVMKFLGFSVQAEVDEVPRMNEMAGFYQARQKPGRLQRLFAKLKKTPEKRQLSSAEKEYLVSYFNQYDHRLAAWIGRPLPW